MNSLNTGLNNGPIFLLVRAESLIYMTHEQSLNVLIRQVVLFGTENVLAKAEKPLTCSTGWDTGVELYKNFSYFWQR